MCIYLPHICLQYDTVPVCTHTLLTKPTRYMPLVYLHTQPYHAATSPSDQQTKDASERVSARDRLILLYTQANPARGGVLIAKLFRVQTDR